VLNNWGDENKIKLVMSVLAYVSVHQRPAGIAQRIICIGKSDAKQRS
jgi:hypothetical protein